ncbi:ABC transporter ATP-binding protein [Halomonas sp. FeN2]|uniref:ABC transporter ATP-binding protein n=1 Tax=Halomonas sp. FeN2 TaxID=2832500 RepID=UPI000C443330|nr:MULTISPECIES: ABC transporter ATP-binding protein [unclassified Halomonas]MBF58091.1 ABC transporter ATP-binding protein [Halomonas sp.]UBR51357.1 ABC transporter ATP-binding protein [Halomonas sp. FeN2]|tara:strand:- start:4347 stop:5438 length:1092 start_codon:yes stop_codon:yes gene_type:complete
MAELGMAVPSSAGLSIDRVTKRFGEQTAVDALSLTINPGEFVALLGPSGCGKTTMLRMLAGFETANDGTIQLANRTLASADIHVPPEQRNMAMVFQSYALWPHMSVADNVGYPVKLRGLRGAAYHQKVQQALALVELDAYADRMPQALSGGQRQRVALARCLVSDPSVVLLDEPLANLDRHLRATMEHSFRDFHQRTGATLVYVTHDQTEAMALADKIAVMKAGKLVQWGTPETLYRQPRTAWVAGFIGQGSQLKVAAGHPGKRLENAALMRGLNAITSERTQSVLVRPEHIQITMPPASSTAPSHSQLVAQVESVIFRGERYELTLRLPSGETLLAYHQSAPDLGSQVVVDLQQGWCLEPDQ